MRSARATQPDRAAASTGHPDARFQPTGEVFVDPTTRVRMRVWSDPATGERRYVPDG